MGFVFYDTETTGTNTFFDQILQFAAIHTDEHLNEMDRFEVRCRLQPHIVMSPGAMLVTGVSLEQATDPKHPTHYSMIRAIRAKLLEWSPAIFVGYNSMRFDEELLRQAQYQTLHNPYLTQRDGNTRADAMMLVKAVAEFEPSCLHVPTNEKGKPSFKLDRVAPANGFDHRNAHDAMADVEAVIHLAQIAAQKAVGEWSNFIRFSAKATVEEFLLDGDPVLLTEFFGFGGHKHFPVVCIGADREQATKHLCYDLSNDPNAFRGMSDAALLACFHNKPKPLRKVKINAAPVLRALDEAPPFCLGALSESQVQQRAADVQGDLAFIARLLDVYEASKEVYEASEHVEHMIYGGFPTLADERLMDEFHQAPWQHRHNVLEQFADQRYALLGARLIYIEDPSHLPEGRRQHIRSHFNERVLFEQECDWGTVHKAIAECDTLHHACTPDQRAMLQRYRSTLVAMIDS